MTEPAHVPTGSPDGLVGPGRSALSRPEPASLADVLERVLDKGIVIAGDIKVNLVDVELLTIRLRLLVASVDRAREMGIDWWEHDPMLSSAAHDRQDREKAQRRIGRRQGARRGGDPELAAEDESSSPGGGDEDA